MSFEMPKPQIFFLQVVFCVIIEDFFFYIFHNALHTSLIYPKIHKIHHEYKVPISISALHVHPLEFVFVNVIPVFIGTLILGKRMHLASVFGLVGMRTMEAYDGHCGYNLSWSPFKLLPMQVEGNYHDYHHEGNVGNYGSFTKIWDTVFGTNTDYFKE